MGEGHQIPSDSYELPDFIAYLFDDPGTARKLSLDEFSGEAGGTKSRAFTWIYLNRGNSASVDWLRRSGVDNFVIDALTAEETRPRCTVHADGVLLNLRGVNLKPGEEPEDMISIRLWIEAHRVITIGQRPLNAVRDLMDAVDRGQSPVSPGDLVAKLALRLADRAEPTVSALNEHIDQLEELMPDRLQADSRERLADIRRMSIVLRRYMIPQRDALTTFEIEDLDWLTDRERSRIREAAERVTRLGEELDAIRDRAQIVHDQILDSRAETMNRQMLVLSVVAAIFLPLGLLTGLLGINVGGIPGADNPWAFIIVCGLLALVGGFQAWLFKRIGLF